MILKLLKMYIKEVFTKPKIDKKTIKVAKIVAFLIGTIFVPTLMAYIILCYLLNNVFIIITITLIIACISLRGTCRTIDKLDNILDDIL